ncbi:MAG: MgtC/SapB family protein [Chromatiaceae bacterium]|nr:MAG: MgtC/SapB family protein [Chromatiaceae bacterium]
MEAIERFDLAALLNTLLSLSVAFVLGGLIGLERQYRQRTAGLRTNVLVAVGAALFVDLAVRMHGIFGGTPGAVHVVAYVVSGVGFLGAGVIMREEGNVRGLNTAATLWGSAAVGAAAGADLVAEAALGALFVLSANTLLRPVVNRMNRRPIDEATEISYEVKVIAPRAHQKEALEVLEEALEQASYPPQQIDIELFGQDDVEIAAILLATSVDPDELDALISDLRAQPSVREAFWSTSANE